MKTIAERAKEYAPDPFDPDYILPAREGFIVKQQRNAYITGATEQKAIDEEVRLKKCDDMTQAEYDREVAFAEWYHKNGNGTPTFSDAIEWARKKVIDKACDWLDTYLMDIGYPDDWLRDSPNIKSGKERFRKAMDEYDGIDKLNYVAVDCPSAEMLIPENCLFLKTPELAKYCGSQFIDIWMNYLLPVKKDNY